MSCKVGIAGAGSIAFGSAALLQQNGHEPMLWSPSGASTKALEDGPLEASGAVETVFAPRVATSAQELAE